MQRPHSDGFAQDSIGKQSSEGRKTLLQQELWLACFVVVLQDSLLVVVCGCEMSEGQRYESQVITGAKLIGSRDSYTDLRVDDTSWVVHVRTFSTGGFW